ncbi:hypothetical protein [Flammeovirga sp. SubArs3]|uniref:hypothetical protein n=1 Tax=Flammeovirga sp. SubArs3 TaxID=2995316 RepID=UPI00248CB16E|nr:hypothetical protein [Flammeovirga sp. SubArs3]
MVKPFIYFSIFFLFCQNVIADEFRKGVIISTKLENCCIYIPSSGLKLYKEPLSTTNVGEIYMVNDYKLESIINGKTNTFEKGVFEVMNDVYSLFYINKRNGFVQLSNNYWVSIDELQNNNLTTQSWLDYAISKGEDVLGWYAPSSGLVLREAPSKDSKQIAVIKGDLWEITLSNQKKGSWCKVTINEYNLHPCSSYEENTEPKIINTLTGWIKVITDDQELCLWSYKGC